MHSIEYYGGCEYRLGDFVSGYLARIEPDFDAVRFFCTRWPRSVACDLARTNTSIPAIARSLHAREARCRSTWNVSIHLRLGDVFDWDARYDCHARIHAHRDCHYAATPERIRRVVQPLCKNCTVALLGNPNYRASSLHHNGSKSVQYAQMVYDALSEFAHVTALFHRTVDCDLMTLTSSPVVVVARRGQFAHLVRRVAQYNGRRVAWM